MALPQATTSPTALLVLLPLKAMLQRLLLVLRPESMLALLLSLLLRHVPDQPPPLGWANPQPDSSRHSPSRSSRPVPLGCVAGAVRPSAAGASRTGPQHTLETSTSLFLIMPVAAAPVVVVVAVDAVQSAVQSAHLDVNLCEFLQFPLLCCWPLGLLGPLLFNVCLLCVLLARNTDVLSCEGARQGVSAARGRSIIMQGGQQE